MLATLALVMGACTSAVPNATLGTTSSMPATPPPSIAPTTAPSPTPSSPPTAAPTPSAVTSNTVAATSAPKGAIPMAFLGPPPHYGPATLTSKAGMLVLSLSNTSLAAHNIAIGAKVNGSIFALSDNVEVGNTAVFTVRGLTPGTYAYWCTIDNHAADGMIGTLTVQ